MFDYVPVESAAPAVVYESVVEAKKDLSWHIHLGDIADSHLQTMNSKDLDRDWKLHEFFETILVINLPHAGERLDRFKQEMQKIGSARFEIFQAINGRKDLPQSIWGKMIGNRDNIDTSNGKGKLKLDLLHQGEAGCYMSHYLALKGVKEKFDEALLQYQTAQMESERMAAAANVRKYSRVLIFEDDSGFGFVRRHQKSATLRGAGSHLRKALKELPEKWDLLYFIIHPTQPTKQISPSLYKIRKSWCAAAYAVNHTLYEPLLKKLKQIEDPLVTSILPVDGAICSLHKHYNVYAIYPSIVFHHPGKSQISARSNHSLWQGQAKYKKKK